GLSRTARSTTLTPLRVIRGSIIAELNDRPRCQKAYVQQRKTLSMTNPAAGELFGGCKTKQSDYTLDNCCLMRFCADSINGTKSSLDKLAPPTSAPSTLA